MLIIGSAPVNFFYFIFLLKTKESASLAWLFLHTGRWPACIESVFYWICGRRIFSLETLITALHTLVEYCDYGNLRDQMVRDRIVVGLANAKLSERLQLDRKLTLDTAVTQARQDETVRKQQATLRGAAKDSTVSALHKGKHLPREKKITVDKSQQDTKGPRQLT